MKPAHRLNFDTWLGGMGFLRGVVVLLFSMPAALFGHARHHLAVAASSPVPLSRSGIAESLTGNARIAVRILDAKLGEPTPVRVRITDENGKPLGVSGGGSRLAAPGSVIGLPPEAIGVMYGPSDTAQGFAFQPDGSFYVNGAFAMPMPTGRYVITISKGCEYVQERDLLVLKPGDNLARTYRLRRWIDMPERGWYSADDHIHLRRSPRENPLILGWIAAEDVHVGILLQMGDFWATYFSQYAWGAEGRYSSGNHMLLSGQEEPRTSEIGHTISFGADQFVRFRDEYYAFDKVFDRVHERGGVAGYAHQGMSFHGYRGMTLDVPAGKVDFLELMQFCVPEGPLALDHYYRFLDLGYKLTALGGSDFPWCGRGRRPNEENVGPQIGNARFYTYTGNPFTFDKWMAGVKAGNTFVTTGPMLEFRVNGRLPGSSIDVRPGTKLSVRVTSWGQASQCPLTRLQLIGHGRVFAEARPGGRDQTPDKLTIDFEFAPEHGIWLAARADAGLVETAHTTPVYVTIDGDGFHNRANLDSRIDESKRCLQEIRDMLDASPDSNSPLTPRLRSTPHDYPGTRERLEQRIAEAERTLEQLRDH